MPVARQPASRDTTYGQAAALTGHYGKSEVGDLCECPSSEFWDSEQCKLREALARLVDDVLRAHSVKTLRNSGQLAAAGKQQPAAGVTTPDRAGRARPASPPAQTLLDQPICVLAGC